MTTTKQLHPPTQRRQANGGKTYAMTKNTSNRTVIIDGVKYSMNDLVPRHIALKIAKFDYTYFSTKITNGEIEPKGRGQQTRFLVADCVRLYENKHSRKHTA